jgi:hypothetical protein
VQETTSLGTPSNESSWNSEAYSSGVSWAAVIAGAFVAAPLWLTLLALGTEFRIADCVALVERVSISIGSECGRHHLAHCDSDRGACVGGCLAGRFRT